MMAALVLNLKPVINLTDDAFYELCQQNRDLQLERNAQGELIIMPPTGGETGNRNFSLAVQFGIWAEKDATGLGFDSSTGFKLPNGADRSPDLAWVKLDRWHALTPEQRQKFPPICPDFVVEIRSETDSLTELQTKMTEYIDNGAALGLLLNPKGKEVEIYRPGVAKVVLKNPSQVDCHPAMPGLILNMAGIL